ncbi:MAG TPA: DUF4386 domain-containing protein, partial [Gemmatimonadales bacterium]|nr:DUF4386 domain-containing protein [Gemmatimonadales bacterium]
MARLAGALLLLTVVLGGAGQSLQGQLLVVGDPAGTARHLGDHSGRLWLAFAAYMVELSCQLGFTVVVYQLLRPVSRTGSALAACFGILGIVVKVAGRCCLIFPTLVLGNANHLTALAAGQRELLAYLALGMNADIA